MAQLLEAIISYYENGTDANAVALRALLGANLKQFAGDFDLEKLPMPYVVVAEGETKSIEVGTNYSWRYEECSITFHVFAATRQAAYEISEAIDTAYVGSAATTAITTAVSDRAVLGQPRMESRQPAFRYDNWECNITFSWPLEKTFS